MNADMPVRLRQSLRPRERRNRASPAASVLGCGIGSSPCLVADEQGWSSVRAGRRLLFEQQPARAE